MAPNDSITLPSSIDRFQLGAILDGIPARVALLDRESRYLYVNTECARFADRPPESLIGKTAWEVLGQAAFDAMREYGDKALAGQTVRWEGWLPYAEGSDPRYVQRVCMPYRSEGGPVEGYLVFVWDLTELRRGERRITEQSADLEMSQALGAAIIASALDCVIMIDEAGCVVEFNPAAERTFGHSREAVLGRPIGDIIVPAHLRERHARGFERYLATGEAHVLGRRVEIQGLRATGEVFPLELTITEVRMTDRRLFTAYLRDLTAVHAAAAEIQKSRDALHQSEKMAAFGSLLAGVAHELNNPLSIVVGNAMMLVEDAAEAEPVLANRAEKIQTAAERCARIVRTFLSMARERPIVLRPFALGPLVAEALELLAYSLRTSGVVVDLDVADGGRQAVGDPDQVTQVVVNLLINAQQALMTQPPPRRIAVTASYGPERVMLSVVDNGPGVRRDIRDRIFDPFFTTKPMGAGTGIGLAVSRGIIEAHGGALTLTSPPEGGARFDVTLRVATSDDARPSAAAAPQSAAPLSMLTALIVDDEPEVAAVLARMVSASSFRCDVALGGAEACALLAERDYDVILCDMHMPDMSGAALFEWLQGHKPHLCARLVFVTGDVLGQATSGFLARAARPVLEKPFVLDEVRSTLRQLRLAGGARPEA